MAVSGGVRCRCWSTTRWRSTTRRIADHYAGLDRQLAERDYLCGDFSVADIGYFMTLTFATSLGAAPAAELSALTAWSQRVMARPAVTREVVGRQTAAANL